MKVWVVLDVTEWSRDIVGVFTTRDAAIQAMDRMTSWAFSIEEWEVETDGSRPAGSHSPTSSRAQSNAQASAQSSSSSPTSS